MTARSALQLPGDLGGLEERIKQQRRRVERVLAFLLDLEGALRRDLDLAVREGRPGATGRVAELERAAGLRREAQAGYGSLQPLHGRELLARLEALDLEPATLALQALRDALAAPAPEALPTRTQTAPLPPQVKAVGPYQRDRAAPGLADRAFLHGRKGFEAAYRLGTELLTFVTPRLTMVQAALGVTGLPGPRRPWEEVAAACPRAAQQAGIAPPMAPWVPKLARLFHGQVDVARKAFVAVNHWQTARQLHQHAEVLAGRLEAPTAAAELQRFPTGRYYGALFPLGNLHLHFQGVPHMGKLFPPPEPSR